jgi:hypothetical protein
MFSDYIPALPHPDSDRAYYRAGSWEAYASTLAHHAEGGPIKPDQGAFLPSPHEIDNRIGMMRWLESLDFDAEFISSVLIHDTPSIERVVQMIGRYGPIEMYYRCESFIHREGEKD